MSLKDEKKVNSLRKSYVILYAALSEIWNKQAIGSQPGSDLVFNTEVLNIDIAVHYAIDLNMWTEALSTVEYLTVNLLQIRGDARNTIRLLKKFLKHLDTVKVRQSSLNFRGHLIRSYASALNAEEKFDESLEILKEFILSLELSYSLKPVSDEYILCYISLINLQINRRNLIEAKNILAKTRPLVNGSSEHLIKLLRMCEGRISLEDRKYDEAYEHYFNLIELHKKEQDLVSLGIVYHQLGLVREQQFRFGEAKDWYIKALRLRELHGIQQYIYSDSFNLGMLAESQGFYHEAIKWLTDAFKAAQRSNKALPAAKAAYRLGVVNEQLDNFDDADAWLKLALVSFTNFNDILQQGHVYHEQGILLMRQEKFTLALQSFKVAYNLYTSCNDIEYQAGSIMYIGTLHNELADYENATTSLKLSISLYRKLKYPPKLITALLNTSMVEFSWKEYRKSIELIYKAFSISIDYKNHQMGDIYMCIQQIISSEEDLFFDCWNRVALVPHQAHSVQEIMTLTNNETRN